MNGVSVVTITFNEERNIENFINSHRLIGDEIIIVDSGSTDRTVELARRLGATIYFNTWEGYAKQWNFGIKKCNYKWVLIGDADHVMTRELANEISMELQNSTNDGYFIPRKNIMFGKWIKHGGFYPDMPYPRLFKKGFGLFNEDEEVHEKLYFTGNTLGTLKQSIEHYTYLNFNMYLNKMNKYTSLEALNFTKNKKGIYTNTFIINGKINKAAFRRKLPFRPLLVFLYRYFFMLGFLDGVIGFYLAFLSGFYEALVNIKVWEQKTLSIL